MSIAIGTQLGSHEITALLGKGGMGEVYRARDMKLKREVAIKILPDEFVSDPDRISRFQREAELLASLNHSNIAAIYDLQESAGSRYLVMELVEGETLLDRIGRGPIAIEEALDIGRRICEAIEAAHEKGVIHRDLKPGNVKITPDGDIKVLDFGLAKALDRTPGSANLSQSPTMAGRTMGGMIIGTAAYMSPEQARGRAVDARTDVWAFGCLMYEMLAGKQAFHGEDVTEILASVVKTEPDWRALPANIPANIRTLLLRCLQKDIKKRIRNAGDIALELEEAMTSTASVEAPMTIGPHFSRRSMVIGLACLLLGGLITGLAMWRLKPAPAAPAGRFAMLLPGGQRLAGLERSAISFSPDGKRLAYVATAGGPSQLYLRDLDNFEAKPVPGTEGGASPFFSPDGQWIGFFTEDTLKKVSVSGGPPVNLARVADFGRGGSWGGDGNIVFAPEFNSGLSVVSSAGGPVQSLTAPDRTKSGSHRFPHRLPGVDALLFTVGTGGSWDDAQIEVLKPDTKERKVLIQGGSDARYVPTGHLVFLRAATLLAVSFDLQRLQVTGSPVPVVEGILPSTDNTGSLQAAFADSGSLIYVSGDGRVLQRTLVWVDRDGTEQSTQLPLRTYTIPRLSSGGTRMAVDIDEGNKGDIWIGDLLRGTLARLTSDGASFAPLWNSDGKKVFFGNSMTAPESIYWKNADGAGSDERLTTVEPYSPESVTPDGQTLTLVRIDSATGRDIWKLSLKDRRESPYLKSPSNESKSAISPNGGWVAYQSDDSGRDEIYVQTFPTPGSKELVSTGGGTEPVWSRNGRELFYRNGDKMMAVAITTQPAFHASKPEVLFEKPYLIRRYDSSYDVAPDGRFLMIKENEQVAAANVMNVVLNWFEELTRKTFAKQ